MFRQLFFIFLMFIFHSSSAQKTNNSLVDINSIEQAEAYITGNPAKEGKIFTIQSGTDTSAILLPLYNQKTGYSFSMANTDFKILGVDSVLSFRVSYIYLNGEQLTKKQVDSFRSEIITSYKNGTGFIELVQQFNMDGNPTGDTQWFTENTMVKEFETAVKQHRKGEIFTVDTPVQQWYHVVLKTFDDTYIKTLTILRMNNSSLK